MWSQYGPRSMLVAHRELSSAGGGDAAQDLRMPYVVNDIATFFTLLVGIYFPSVTGAYRIMAYGRNRARGIISPWPRPQVSWPDQTGQVTCGTPRSPFLSEPSWPS